MKKIYYYFATILLLFTCCKKEETEKQVPTHTMEPVEIVDGVIQAPYSVDVRKTVFFSQGNLQYNAAIDKWRFAEEQYEIRGEENKEISPTYNGWIDLFGWGTSGYNGYMPYMTARYASSYPDPAGGIKGTNYDWGVYNAISNGGNKKGSWRTLTEREWSWLINRKNEYSNLCYYVKIHDIYGILLLPDNFDKLGLSFRWAWASGDEISDSHWRELQKYGAVFLPKAGERSYSTLGDSIKYSSSEGGYWTSTKNGSSQAYYLTIGYRPKTEYFGYKAYGYSVRLVKDN